MARFQYVRIGTSGWNYPASGYGPWTGVFYPLKQGQTIPGTKQKFDELAYYAGRFNTVEINNTFYRPPSAKMAESWAKRTPKGLEFSQSRTLRLFQCRRAWTGSEFSRAHAHRNPLEQPQYRSKMKG